MLLQDLRMWTQTAEEKTDALILFFEGGNKKKKLWFFFQVCFIEFKIKTINLNYEHPSVFLFVKTVTNNLSDYRDTLQLFIAVNFLLYVYLHLSCSTVFVLFLTNYKTFSSFRRVP